ncbi:MAG: hypothetical protein D6806_04500, partial [Deltaproteobacteria bacterium]
MVAKGKKGKDEGTDRASGSRRSEKVPDLLDLLDDEEDDRTIQFSMDNPPGTEPLEAEDLSEPEEDTVRRPFKTVTERQHQPQPAVDNLFDDLEFTDSVAEVPVHELPEQFLQERPVNPRHGAPRFSGGKTGISPLDV